MFRVRECNRAANELAKLGYDCVQGEEQITTSIPGSVLVMVTNDLLAVE